VRLAEPVTDALFQLGAGAGGAVDDYEDEPASLILLLGLRAAFPCADGAALAQR
jgi:hypothetical protein